MNRQITVYLAALALGTVLVSAPAFAQKPANDGGLIAEPNGSAASPSQQERAPAGRRSYNSAPTPAYQQPSPSKASGKPANDGGPM